MTLRKTALALCLPAMLATHAGAAMADERTSAEKSPAEAAALRFIDGYNSDSANWLDSVHAKDCVWIEMPVYGVYPGHTGACEGLRKLGAQTLAQFPGRRMKLLSVVASGRRAAMEIEWTGIAKVATPHIKAGEKLTIRQATFIDIDDQGKVVRQIDYTIKM